MAKLRIGFAGNYEKQLTLGN